MADLPCFLCGRQLDQRTDKNQKPYFVCDPCGMQIFIRRKQGIEKLQRLIRDLNKHSIPLREHTQTLFEVRAILDELAGIQDELKKLDSSISIFSRSNKEKSRARKLLKKRMQTLLNDLARIAESE